MKRIVIAACTILAPALLLAETTPDRLSSATSVLTEIMQAPDKGIPQDLMAKAACVVIIPGVKKAAFVVGAEYGRGFAVCRRPGGVGWTAPAAVRVEGGSVGFQIGGSGTDVIMIVRNERGMNRLLSDKFTLGADASVAAGPVGRTAAAQTDAAMTAEILTWSRSKGIFAGISLNGATLRPDRDANEDLYGRKMDNKEVLTGDVKTPPGAHELHAALDRYSMRKEGPDAERSRDK
jgi:lipid-binding SYLF domain-containing protein